MRIVEPQKTSEQPHKISGKHHRSKITLLIIVLSVSAVLVFIISTKEAESPVVPAETMQVNGDKTEIVEAPTNFEISGNQLRIFYDQIRQANTNAIPLPPVITGNEIADTRIVQLAEQRGYRLRTVSESNLAFYGGLRLQRAVIDDWENMQQAASRDSVRMSITSGYRTIEEQRQLFLSRLRAQGATVSTITEGTADDAIIEVLKTTAVPGYSKHHSGYTIDLLCAGTAFENFKESSCHEWLSENNYERAFEFGFIPSYPDGADLQGPEPEAWEYVWVGERNLYFQ